MTKSFSSSSNLKRKIIITKKWNNDLIGEEIEQDLEWHRDEEPRCAVGGDPWLFRFVHKQSTGEQLVEKSLRFGHNLSFYLEKEIGLLHLAKILKIPDAIQIHSIYQAKRRKFYTQFSILFPRFDIFTTDLILSLTLTEIFNIIQQLSNALKSLHHHNIVHRDIKTSNIVYDSQNKEVYIIDFGHAELLFPGIVHQFKAGIRGYRAPEVGEFNSIFPQSDLYSLDVLLINLLIPTLTPVVTRKLNFDEEMIEKDLIDWKIYLRTKKVSEYRSKILVYFKSADQSSPFDPLLL